MAKPPPEPEPPPRAVDRARAAREARQAAALRANLRRRKAQARGREAAGTAGPDDEAPKDAGQG